MKTKILFPTLLLMVGLATGASAFADDIVKPSIPPAGSGGSERSSVDEPAIIDHVAYLAKLPSADELMKGAELKATPILRMDQTADRIVVVYQYAGGRTVTFAYVLLSSTGSSRAPVTAAPSGVEYRVVSPSSPPPPTTTVIYSDPDVVYYSPRVRYYDPAWDFWTPLAVGVGLGWGFGGHGWHGDHDGWHGGGGWHGGHGGWHH